jgi:hypothetical protein
MTEFNELFERAKLQRVARNQRRLLKDEIQERLIVGYNGGLFKADSHTIHFAKLLLEENKTKHPLLDMNGYPVMVDDMQDFYETVLGRFTEVVNEVWVDYQNISESKTVAELLDAEIEQESTSE